MIRRVIPAAIPIEDSFVHTATFPPAIVSALCALNSAGDLESVLLTASRTAMALAGAENAALLLMDRTVSAQMTADPAPSGGVIDGLLEKIRRDPGLVQSLLQSDGSPAKGRDTKKQSARWALGLECYWVDTIAVLPIRHGEGILGILLLESPAALAASRARDHYLALFMTQIAVAIQRCGTLGGLHRLIGDLASENAGMAENQRRAIAESQAMNAAVERQWEWWRRILWNRHKLCQMVLDGQGVEAIASALARIIGNPVTVSDRFGEDICGWQTAGQDEAESASACPRLDAAAMQALIERLAKRTAVCINRETRPVRLPPGPQSNSNGSCVVASIVVNRETVGYLFVLEQYHQLGDMDLITVEVAAIALALEMMKERAAAEARFSQQRDLVLELVAGTYGSETLVLKRASHLGIDLQRPRAVLVVKVDDSSGFATMKEGGVITPDLKGKLVDLVEHTCRRSAPGSVVSASSDEIIILATTSAGEEDVVRAELCQLGDRLRSEVQNWLPEISVSVGVGSIASCLGQLAQAYREGCQALWMVKATRQANRSVTYDQVGVYGLLFDPHNREKLATFVRGTVGRLLDYDRRHGTELIDTLYQYLNHGARLETAAAALYVHPNTLRYRLRRVEEISGADLSSSEVRFNFQLALKALTAAEVG